MRPRALLAGLASALALVLASGTADAAVSFKQRDYTLDSASRPQAVTTADFDHKNGPDIAITDSGYIEVLLNKGDGTFQDPIRSEQACGTLADSIVAADLTGDGKPDVAVSCAPYLVQLKGNGDGTFQSPQQSEVYPNASQLRLGHMNGPTLVFSRSSGGPFYLCYLEVSEFESNLASPSSPTEPTCDFNANPPYVTNPIDPNAPIKFAHIPTAPNGNDAAFTFGNNQSTGHDFFDATVYLGPNPSAPTASPFASTGERPSDGNLGKSDAGFGDGLAVGDVNGDGKTDVVMGDGSKIAKYVPVYPLGANQPPVQFNTLPQGVYQLELVDINGDGKLDVVGIGNANDGTNATLVVHPGHGDGTFGPYQPIATHGYHRENGEQLAVADLNHDGRRDLVSINESGNTATVLLNTTAPKLPQKLTVKKHGKGKVTSSPVGINCGTTCTHTFGFGTQVTLHAHAKKGWKFKQWSGSCTGTGACHVTMTTARTVTVTFKKKKHKKKPH